VLNHDIANRVIHTVRNNKEIVRPGIVADSSQVLGSSTSIENNVSLKIKISKGTGCCRLPNIYAIAIRTKYNIVPNTLYA
jgi:hypothetical protein